MARRLPPLNALRAFEAAARHGSFTKAANELCVTPGAVSRQVQLLEEHLGMPLFTRMNREIVISPQGARYRESLTAAFDQINTSTCNLRADKKLHLTSYTTFTMRWLIPRLPTFRQDNTDYGLMVTTNPPSIFDISSGTVDLAVLSGTGDWPGVEVHELFPIHLEPVCTPESLATTRLDAPEDLANTTLLHSIARPDDWASWIHSVEDCSVASTGGIMFENSLMAFEASLNGMGAAIGQTVLLAPDLEQGRLVAPYSHKCRDGTGFYLVYSSKLADDKRIKRFRKWILDEAEAYRERYAIH